MTARPKIAHLRFAPDILARLGEELIPDPDQGLLELARNAYDAGATRCVITLASVDAAGGSVTITDDGDGMDAEDIINGFLVLGRSRKIRRRRHRGRLPVGEKGLGRLAALRLGGAVTLTTRPRGSAVEHQLAIDWSSFDRAGVVEDVPLQIVTTPTRRKAGTEIRIDRLHRPLTQSQQNSLARALLLLSDPFGQPGDFEAVLQTEQFENLADIIRGAYLAAADFHLIAQVDSDGCATAQLLGLGDRKLAQADHEELAQSHEPYQCPEATLELFVFRLGGGSAGDSNLQLRGIGIAKVRSWLREVGGVHLYHRGLRVRPFGDPGYDWVQLDVRRVRSPEDRPSTNTVVGRVSVEDEDDALLPKTDRLGFVENEAFTELRRFAIDATEFMARWRIEDSRRRRLADRQRAESSVEKARSDLASAVSKLPPAERQRVERAVRTFDRATTRRDEARLRDVQLYRTLSTIGAATSVFAHEADKPTEHLLSLLKSAKRRAQRELGERFTERLAEPFDELNKVANGLRALARMPLRLLRADKRRTRSTAVSEAVSEVLDTFAYFIERAGVNVIRDFADRDLVYAAPAALEVIVANMVVNAVAAFYSDQRPHQSRTLRIATTTDERFVTLEVSDDGPGFVRISPADVWKLGETRREGGSGLGLTIVRDAVTDLGGTAEAASPGTLGGATFVIRLPRAS